MFHRLATDEISFFQYPLGLFQRVEKSVLKEEVCLDKHFRNGTTARVGKVFFSLCHRSLLQMNFEIFLCMSYWHQP